MGCFVVVLWLGDPASLDIGSVPTWAATVRTWGPGSIAIWGSVTARRAFGSESGPDVDRSIVDLLADYDDGSYEACKVEVKAEGDTGASASTAVPVGEAPAGSDISGDNEAIGYDPTYVGELF